MSVDEAPTRALREGSAAVLRDELHRLLRVHEDRWLEDPRDLLLSLAPYHDCAWRLGLDPTAFFDHGAEQGPASLRELVRTFGRRRDVTLEAFGYDLIDSPEGRRYTFVA
jgi:hypothetical protein